MHPPLFLPRVGSEKLRSSAGMGLNCHFRHAFSANVPWGHIRDAHRLQDLEPSNPPLAPKGRAPNLNLKGDPLLSEVRVFFLRILNELTFLILKV